jgi:hypothetical protein
MIEIVGAHRVRVQLEAREVGHPEQCGGVARHNFLRRPSGRKPERDDLDPRQARLRRALLKEKLAAGAVRIPHEDIGPSAGAAQRAVGDSEVVARQVELGVSGLRKENLSGIRDRDLATGSRQQCSLGGLRHGRLSYWGQISIFSSETREKIEI